MLLLATESLQNPIWFGISLARLVKGSYLCTIIYAHGKMSVNYSFNINFFLVMKSAHYRKFGRLKKRFKEEKPTLLCNTEIVTF